MSDEACSCSDCAEANGDISKVGGEYTAVWIADEDNEDEGIDYGDIVDEDYTGSKAEHYQCDYCQEIHLWESDAESCCEKWECNFCGETFSESYYSSAKDKAAECCLMSCGRCDFTGSPNAYGDHPCENGKGARNRTLPWEKRGIHVDASRPQSDHWKSVWGFRPEKVNVVQASADYYLLEAIKSGLVGTVGAETETGISAETGQYYTLVFPNAEVANHGLMRIIRSEASERFQALVDEWDPILRAYTHMAVGGELRHHNAVGGNIMSDDRDSAWTGWKLIFEAVGPDALTDAAELFEEFSGGSFGGEPWANACLILHARETGQIDPALFLDRIFNAQHNGGCLLNKVNWAGDKRNADGFWTDDAMQLGEMQGTVLPAHGCEPEPDYSTLLAYASREVRALFADAHEFGRRARLDLGMTLAGIPARAKPGRTAMQERAARNAQAQAEQDAYNALPKSAKLEKQIPAIVNHIQQYTTYAKGEAIENANMNMNAVFGLITCYYHDKPCLCKPHPSTYYQDMAKYYTQQLADLYVKIATAKVKEANPEYACTCGCNLTW